MIITLVYTFYKQLIVKFCNNISLNLQFSTLDILYIFKSIKNTEDTSKMALLLAMYQKMRLIREKNQVTLDLTKYTSKLDRVQKNIEKVQKRYTSLFAQLEQQAKRMENDFAYSMRQGLGLGTDCVNMNNLGGMNGIVYSTVMGMLTQDPNGPKYSPALVNDMLTEYNQLLKRESGYVAEK